MKHIFGILLTALLAIFVFSACKAEGSDKNNSDLTTLEDLLQDEQTEDIYFTEDSTQESEIEEEIQDQDTGPTEEDSIQDSTEEESEQDFSEDSTQEDYQNETDTNSIEDIDEEVEEVEDTTEDTEPELPTVEEFCFEINATDCFSNYDCEENQRCQNIGATEWEVPCCVTGARGEKNPGEGCTEAGNCSSGLCISRNDGPHLCSDSCESNDDCPENMQDCGSFYFVEGLWCKPTVE